MLFRSTKLSDFSRALTISGLSSGLVYLIVSPIYMLPDFREVGFGEWEGLKYDQIYASWSAEIEMFFRSPSKVEIPGGETHHRTDC